jgi:hypothetical protein
LLARLKAVDITMQAAAAAQNAMFIHPIVTHIPGFQTKRRKKETMAKIVSSPRPDPEASNPKKK